MIGNWLGDYLEFESIRWKNKRMKNVRENHLPACLASMVSYGQIFAEHVVNHLAAERKVIYHNVVDT
jgi:hypothetical protein